MTDFISEILLNEPLTADFYRMRFTLDKNLQPQPGQFFSLKDELPTDTLLRRPFAFSDADNGAGEMIYQIRGKTTQSLSQRKVGDKLRILAPCGNGFSLDKTNKQQPILIAGGVGLGPMLFLFKTLRRQGKQPILIAGFRTATFVPHAVLPTETIVCTDDGSFGFHGNVIDALDKQPTAANSRLFCCGPMPMMKAAAAFAETHALTTAVSLEAMMGCSLGACMGCAVPVKGGDYKRVCKEGPVFDSGEIIWNSI